MPRTLHDAAKVTLGKNLKEIRKRHRWTQGTVATHVGVSRERVTLWETGKESPGVDGLMALAVAYGCSVDQFLSGVNEAYDSIIEARLPADAAAHYKQKFEAFIRRQTAAMQLIATEVNSEPTRPTNADQAERGRGKSSPSRARRKPGK